MRFSFLLLSVALLCCSETFGSQNTQQSQPTKKKFLDLNDDVLLEIFGFVNWSDLLNLLKVHRRFVSLIEGPSRTNDPNYESLIGNQGVQFYVDDEKKEIRERREINIFFNHWIRGTRKLAIDNRKLDAASSAMINTLANQRGANILTHLDLGDIQTNTLAQFTVPFVAVEELTLYIHNNQAGANVQPLNVIFPNLKRLSMILNDECDYHYLNHAFPKLERLRLMVSVDRTMTNRQLIGLIEKNPQIKDIEFHCYPADGTFFS